MAQSSEAATASAPRVDTHLIRFSQAWVVFLTGLGYLLGTEHGGRIVVAIGALALYGR